MKILFIVLSIVLNLLAIALNFILGYTIFHYDVRFYYMTLFFLMGISLGNLILMIIHLMLDKKYTFMKYTPIFHASYLIAAGLIYYAIELFKKYDEYKIIYWSVLIGTLVVLIIVHLFLNLKEKNTAKKIKINDLKK